MLLKSRHATERSLMFEVRHVPLDRFHNSGTSRMNQLPDMCENRPGERGCFGDIRIDARIFGGHAAMLDNGPPPGQSSLTPLWACAIAGVFQSVKRLVAALRFFVRMMKFVRQHFFLCPTRALTFLAANLF
jgi:hypothetical protein